MSTAAADGTRRRYDNTLRQERAAQTRDRILAAAAELLRGSAIRDWQAVTIRAVAERAEVNERTVYRHFANERALRDAVMERLESEAGVDLAHLGLDDVAAVTARILRHVAAYPLDPPAPLDPTLVDANRRRHDALLAAVAEEVPRWPAGDRRLAAAMLDVLWSVAPYERLVVDWELDREDAIRGITWLIGLVEAAVREGARPARALEPSRAAAPTPKPGRTA